MILAIEPDSVRMERAEVDYGHGLDAPKTVFYQPGVFNGDESSGLNYSKTGVRGDPTLATAAKGEALLSAMAKELVEGLRQLYPDGASARSGALAYVALPRLLRLPAPRPLLSFWYPDEASARLDSGRRAARRRADAVDSSRSRRPPLHERVRALSSARPILTARAVAMSSVSTAMRR